MEDRVNNPVTTPPTTVIVPEAQSPGGSDKSKLWVAIIPVVIVLALFITGLVLLIRSDVDTTSHWRDIFIIVMALESLIIGLALIILVIQLATLINLLQHEIKPIIHSTNETINTLKGTTQFLSDNLTGPVIEMNVYLAALKKFFDLIRPGKSHR